jgi:peptide methionine sulfoxide reductase msrA/msrB
LLDKLASLSPFCQSVALNKATEPPFSGQFIHQSHQAGTYLCRRCGQPLWSSDAQFASHCGWPSFDKRLPSTIDELTDEDGIRQEILCKRCHSHLGHVFRGERFTPSNQRDCVNSVILDFVPFQGIQDTEEIIVAGGCFWGVDYLLNQEKGVLLTECGYIGGHLEHPDYETVCSQNTGHFEAVRVIFDVKQTTSLKLLRTFFEIHDPSQQYGQGPDQGPQYQSAAFYFNEQQKTEIESLINQLRKQGLKIYTQVLPVTTFWPAEDYHQNYYQKNQKQPYCHIKTQRFR